MVKYMNNELLQQLVGIKILLGILAAICTAMICIICWAIYVTRWKTTVDMEIKGLLEKNPVSEKDCIVSHENCEKHISSEFGHGSAKFKEIQDDLKEARQDLKDTRKELRGDIKDMKELVTSLSRIVTALLGRNGEG